MTRVPARITRIRQGLLVALATLVLLLSGCAGADAVDVGEPAAPATRSFTDDLGRTVTLDQPPARVAGLSDVLYSLVSYGLKPVAGFGWSGISSDARFDDLDTSGLEEVGSTYGEIDIEALAAARPDVIVTHVYPTDAKGTIDTKGPLYGFKDLTQQAQVEKIAPVVALKMGGSAAQVIERTTELALALGAPTDSGPVAEGRAAFEAASARLKAAAAKDVQVQVIYAEAANVYVAKADHDPALTLYKSLGVDFVPPLTKAYYWDVVSWEDYDTIGGDLVLYSQRGFGAEQLKKLPTFAATGPAKTGQVHPWVFAGMDYVTQAAYITELAGFLESAGPVD